MGRFTKVDFDLFANYGGKQYKNVSETIKEDFKTLCNKFISIDLPYETKKEAKWQNGWNLRTYFWIRIYPNGETIDKPHCINFHVSKNGLYLRIDTDKVEYEKVKGENSFKRTAKANHIWEASLEVYDVNKSIALSDQDIVNWIRNYIIRHQTDFSDYLNEFGIKAPRHIPTQTIPPKKTVLFSSEKVLPLNLILYGPPGTGKTYHTIDKALEIIDGSRSHDTKRFNELITKGRIMFTSFHQSISYEDFIEGIKPEYDDKKNTLKYPVKPGLFKQICQEAMGKEVPFVLIIDEINRGNVANIFGELITLIEDNKREKLSAKLPYSPTEDFTVPANLYIIATMNSADRSVEALDTALRRRFSFVEMMPNSELLKDKDTDGNYWTFTCDGYSFMLKDILDTINSRIEVLKDRDHLIGHSYFMEFKDTNNITLEEMKGVFLDKIIPLLQEYFYGDYERIQLVLGNGFIDETTVQINNLFAGGKTYDGIPERIYHIKSKDEIDIANALQSMGILNKKDNSVDDLKTTIQTSETEPLENEL